MGTLWRARCSTCKPYRLEPGWCYRTETRVVSNDSLDGIGFGYCAVSDMQRVN